MLPRQVPPLSPRGAVLVLIAVLYHSALGILSRFLVSLSDEYPFLPGFQSFFIFFGINQISHQQHKG